MSRPGENIRTVSPDKERIPRKIKRIFLETLIKGKEIIQEPDNSGKREKEDSIIDEKKEKYPHHL